MSRRWVLILLSGLLILSLAACTGASSEGNSNPTQTPTSEGESLGAEGDTDMNSEDGDGDTDENSVIDAAAIFSSKCSSCHGSEREGGGGPPLLPANLTKDPSAYVETITNGSGRMPTWGGRLSMDEINAMVNYILNDPE